MDGQLSALKPGQLWQLPLLILSLLLFGYAAYLFIDPKPGPTADQRIALARSFLAQERSEAAIEVLKKLLKSEPLNKQREGTVHLLLATALEQGQLQLKKDIPANHEEIVDETKRALADDLDIGADGFRRLAASYEVLNNRRDALANYRRALSLDVDRQLKLHRKVIDILIDDENPAAAERELEDYLAVKDLTDAERSWGLGLLGQLAIDEARFAEARKYLDEAGKLAESSDRTQQGEIAYRNGYAAMKLMDYDEAERQFRAARDRMGIGNPLDADAALYLGRIFLAKGDTAQAKAFFADVIGSHLDHRDYHLALMERGLIRLAEGSEDAGLEDLKNVTDAVTHLPKLESMKGEVAASLLKAEKLLNDAGHSKGAMEVMEDELALAPEPEPAFFSRLAGVLEKRSAQVALAADKAGDSAEKLRLQQESSGLLTRAGKAYLKYSKKLTLTSDDGYASNLWKGIECFDKAGNTLESIDALELFVAERPSDAQTPDAILKLGRAYDVVGKLNKAIATYRRNLRDHGTSLAASKSAVPLAQAYMRLGPDHYSMAEDVLLSVVNNNPNLTPDSNEFRTAVFELGRLYYQTGSYEKAIARFEEYAQRYPDDAKQAQLRYQMADSYWKSAGMIADQIAQVQAGTYKPAPGEKPIDRIDLITERERRLRAARDGYAAVIDTYKDHNPAGDLDKLYLKLAYFYQADCTYDLGEFKKSIDEFDKAAAQYPDDPSSVGAYMKIFAAHLELGETEEAARAHSRATVMIAQMPREAYTNGTYVIGPDDNARFLRFAGDSGLIHRPIVK